MIFLASLLMFNGIELGFVYGEFTANFVRESLGEGSIGYIMGIFGAVNVFASFVFGRLHDK